MQYRRRTVVSSALALFFVLASASLLRAQESSISGTVVNASTGEPIDAAQVTAVGTSVGALTDSEGQFRLRLPQQQGTVQLEVQRIGYTPRSVQATVGELGLRIRLSQRAIELNELVVTGTVGEAEVRSVGHTVSKIDAGEIVEQSGTTNLGSLLKGASSGVSVMSSTGTAGSGSKVEIRGMSSFSLASTPLVYVDGIRVNNDAATGPAIQCCSSGVVSRLDDFDPEDIQSIEIVKGPAAATLYGTEATAGVIQIITKDGSRSGGGPNFDLKITQGAGWLGGLHDKIPTNYQLLPSGEVGTIHSLDQLNESPFRTAHSQKYTVSASGSGESVNYYTSLGGDLIEGVDPTNISRRLTGRLNLSFSPNSKWNISESTGITVGKIDLSPDTDVWPALLFARPVLKETDRNGFNRAPPDVARQATQHLQEYRRVTSSLQVQHSPWDDFEHQLIIGADVTTEHSTSTVERMTPEMREWYSGAITEGQRTVDRRDLSVLSVDYHGTLSLDVTDELSSATSVGAQYYVEGGELFSAEGRGFPARGVDVLAGAGTTFGSDDMVESKTIGLFAQQQFSFKDKVYLTAGLRADDNSAFGEDYSVAAYPKVSASWIVREDDSESLLNSLRVRAAYGESGRQPQALAALRSYASVPLADGTSAVSPRFIGNPELSPELGREIELGFDAGLWQDRLSAEVTYYHTWIEDAILQSPIAPSTGFTGVQFMNLGGINKNGFEIALGGEPIRSDDVTLSTNLNLAVNNSEVVDLGGRSEVGIQGGSGSGTLSHRKGYPPGSWFYYKIVSADIDGSGQAVNIMCDGGPGSQPVPCDEAPKVYYGPSSPKYQGSFSANLTLNNRFEVGALLDFNADFIAYDFHKVYRCIYYTICKANNLPQESDPLLVAAVQNPSYGTHIPALDDQSFARLRYISITYRFPQDIASRFLGASNVSLTGRVRNVATWTGWHGLDPEAAFAGFSADPRHGRWEWSNTPQPVQVEVTFRMRF